MTSPCESKVSTNQYQAIKHTGQDLQPALFLEHSQIHQSTVFSMQSALCAWLPALGSLSPDRNHFGFALFSSHSVVLSAAISQHSPIGFFLAALCLLLSIFLSQHWLTQPDHAASRLSTSACCILYSSLCYLPLALCSLFSCHITLSPYDLLTVLRDSCFRVPQHFQIRTLLSMLSAFRITNISHRMTFSLHFVNFFPAFVPQHLQVRILLASHCILCNAFSSLHSSRSASCSNSCNSLDFVLWSPHCSHSTPHS